MLEKPFRLTPSPLPVILFSGLGASGLPQTSRVDVLLLRVNISEHARRSGPRRFRSRILWVPFDGDNKADPERGDSSQGQIETWSPGAATPTPETLQH